MKLNRLKKLFTVLISLIIALPSYSQAYSGQAAANYAEKWWNSKNPNYDSYDSDCTNFTSQCIVAGGFPTKPISDSKITYSNLGKVYSTDSYFSHKSYTRTRKILGVKVSTKKDFVATSTWTLAGKSTSKAESSGVYGFYNWFSTKDPEHTVDFKLTTSSSTLNWTSVNSICKTAEVGDIIQVRHSGQTGKNHSYIVVSKTYNSSSGLYDVGVSAHTNNRNNDSLRSLISDGALVKTDVLTLERITQSSYDKFN